jgi:hypothetical protein
MMTWIFIAAVAATGFAFVRVRRQRKARAGTAHTA